MRSWLLTGMCCLALVYSLDAAEADRVSADSKAQKDSGPAQTNSRGTSVKRILGRLVPDENVRTHVSVRSVFRDVVAPASQATVRVLSDGVQTALGVIVHADGYILTKASEVRGKTLECVLPDGRQLAANRIAKRDDFDLAILRVPAQGLPTIQWSSSQQPPPIGSWLATAGISGNPAGIGVVSTALHESPPPRPVLGVRYETGSTGLLVVDVRPGSGAARAGIRVGDVLATANGVKLTQPDTLPELIQRQQPGDRMKLTVLRNEKAFEAIATLGDGSRQGQPEQVELMDSLGGPLSRRRSGFPSVLQHDTVLRPQDCGSPVVDLDGKVVGLNIARASRVATYALPTFVVQSVVAEMLTNKLVTAVNEAATPVAANP